MAYLTQGKVVTGQLTEVGWVVVTGILKSRAKYTWRLAPPMTGTITRRRAKERSSASKITTGEVNQPLPCPELHVAPPNAKPFHPRAAKAHA